jgi:hypothetical protein
VLHPSTAFAKRGNFLHASGQYGTVDGHALGWRVLAGAASAKDIRGERCGFLDDEDGHASEKGFLLGGRIFCGEPGG